MAELYADTPLVEIHVGLLACHVRKSSTYTADLGKGKHDFDLRRDSVSGEIGLVITRQEHSLGHRRWCSTNEECAGTVDGPRVRRETDTGGWESGINLYVSLVVVFRCNHKAGSQGRGRGEAESKRWVWSCRAGHEAKKIDDGGWCDGGVARRILMIRSDANPAPQRQAMTNPWGAKGEGRESLPATHHFC